LIHGVLVGQEIKRRAVISRAPKKAAVRSSRGNGPGRTDGGV